MKGQVPFEFCLKILHFFFFGCVFDHPKKLCFKIWKSSIKICRFCTDFDDDFDADWQSVFYNLLIINIWATTGTRTPDLLITNELLYQLSYGGNLIFSDLHRNSIRFWLNFQLLNRRPTHYEWVALPTELWWQRARGHCIILAAKRVQKYCFFAKYANYFVYLHIFL